MRECARASQLPIRGSPSRAARRHPSPADGELAQSADHPPARHRTTDCAPACAQREPRRLLLISLACQLSSRTRTSVTTGKTRSWGGSLRLPARPPFERLVARLSNLIKFVSDSSLTVEVALTHCVCPFQYLCALTVI